jgi:hypothetical protein
MTDGVSWVQFMGRDHTYATKEMTNKDNKNSAGFPGPAVDALEGMLLPIAIKDLNCIGDLECLCSRQVIVDLAAGNLLALRDLARVVHLESFE